MHSPDVPKGTIGMTREQQTWSNYTVGEDALTFTHKIYYNSIPYNCAYEIPVSLHTIFFEVDVLNDNCNSSKYEMDVMCKEIFSQCRGLFLSVNQPLLLKIHNLTPIKLIVKKLEAAHNYNVSIGILQKPDFIKITKIKDRSINIVGPTMINLDTLIKKMENIIIAPKLYDV